MDENRFIVGIFNYCDRWCERCAFTSKCRVYTSESELTDEQKDINNEHFWSHIGDSFEKAIEMLCKIRTELGLTANHMGKSEEWAKGKEDRRRILNTEHQRFTKQSIDYGRAAKSWFQEEKVENQFKEKGIQLQKLHAMGVQTIAAEVVEIQNALEVIRWYLFFISPKIQRALSGLEFTWGEEEAPIQNDANGSAKIALIAIQRSMGAWEILRSHFPEVEDDLLDFLVMLDQIKKQLLDSFPFAAQFHRPGFDD